MRWTDESQKKANVSSCEDMRRGSEDGGLPEMRFGAVTLCCFGVSREFEQRLANLSRVSAWKEILADPFVLLDITFDQLFLLVDGQVKNLRAAFGHVELVSCPAFTGTGNQS